MKAFFQSLPAVLEGANRAWILKAAAYEAKAAASRAEVARLERMIQLGLHNAGAVGQDGKMVAADVDTGCIATVSDGIESVIAVSDGSITAEHSVPAAL